MGPGQFEPGRQRGRTRHTRNLLLSRQPFAALTMPSNENVVSLLEWLITRAPDLTR